MIIYSLTSGYKYYIISYPLPSLQTKKRLKYCFFYKSIVLKWLIEVISKNLFKLFILRRECDNFCSDEANC